MTWLPRVVWTLEVVGWADVDLVGDGDEGEGWICLLEVLMEPL